MLTPEYLDGIAEPLQAMLSELQSVIQQDIARRIAKADLKITDTAKWQIMKMQELGESQANIQSAIARTLNLTDKELKALFKTAGIKSLKTDIDLQKAAVDAGKLPANTIPLTASAAVAQVLNANVVRTMTRLKNLTRTVAVDASGKLNQYLDQAQLMVQSGAFTEQQAIDTAVKQLAAEGVSQFDYASGARISVEAGVRRAIVTGVNQATSEVSLNNAAELETDLVEVTSHADARPEHAEWQGGIYSISGKSQKYRKLSEATGYGTVSGLCGANCRHSMYAYIEDVSEQVPKEEYDSATYKAEQVQRYHERMIRSWKRRAATLDAGGVDNTKELLKVREWQNRLKQHLDDTGLTRLPGREQVTGFGRKLASRQRQVVRKAAAGFANPSKNGIIPTGVSHVPAGRIFNMLDAAGYKELRTVSGKISSADLKTIWDHTSGYIQTSNSWAINSAMRSETVSKLPIESQKTIKVLQSVIDKNATDRDFMAVRYADTNYLQAVFGPNIIGATPMDTVDVIKNNIGQIISEKSLVSVSLDDMKNVFRNKPVKLKMEIPDGTNIYVTSNFQESEAIMRDGLHYITRDAKYENGQIVLTVRIIG